MSKEAEYMYINRPVPREYNIEYHVASSSLVQDILWSLNGFGKLRSRKELEGVEPRYVPTVIKASNSSPRVWSEGEYIATLNSVDWSAKAPPGKGKVLRSCLDYHEAYKSGELTPVDVVEALLPLVRPGGEGDKHATAFLCVRADLVRKAAEASAERWRNGKPRSLIDGVVMAVKDEEDLTGHTRSLGTKLDFRSPSDATSYCVQKWLDAGAICLGKTTMHEMGMDTSNNNPNHGTPLNPYCERYYCGGSSGGSAYAVAAGLVPFAMGNDGGGSIRIPSAYCGLFGLKTSHGRISTRPTANLARSTGVAGPLAANMIDLEIAYRIMAEPDRGDPESGMFAPPVRTTNEVEGKGGKRKVLGIFRPWFFRADKEVRSACWKAIEWLERERGYEVVDIEMPMVHEGQLMHATTILTEVLSGCPTPVLSQLTPANKILLSVASKTSSLDFLQAQKLRNLLMQHLAFLFSQHGPGLVIVTPTTPNAGWPHGGERDLGRYGVSDGNMQIRNMEFAFLANFTGNPALSAPVGYLSPPPSVQSAAGGKVPVGLMGMGDWGAEDEVIGFGYDVERYLHEGGRIEARGGVDVFELSKKGN